MSPIGTLAQTSNRIVKRALRPLVGRPKAAVIDDGTVSLLRRGESFSDLVTYDEA